MTFAIDRRRTIQDPSDAEPSGAPPEPARARGPSNDDVLYVGMNSESSAAESEALARFVRLQTVAHGSKDDSVEIGGERLALAVDGGKDVAASRANIAAFVAKLGVSPAVAREVEAVLLRARPGARDELAGIARVWARAERGETIPSRVVLSGHSSGNHIWDGSEKNGSLYIADFLALARAMPRAAAQIEDVHMSACNTAAQISQEVYRKQWTEAFPNLATVWAYAGYSPSAPTHHLQAWASATSGRAQSIKVPAAYADQRAAVWTRSQGYVERGFSLAELRARELAAGARFAALMNGTIRVRTSQDPAARDDYATYQALARRNDVEDPAPYEKRAAQLLRIRFYESRVRAKFATTYREPLEAGFAAAGMRTPDFARLTRAEALGAVRAFEERAEGIHSPEIARARELLRGLVELDERTIPDQWC
jgi:hypothetical protein